MDTIKVYFSLGTNLGDREANLREAVGKMESAFGLKVSKAASFIETKPWGMPDNTPYFLNTVVCFDFPSAGQSPECHCRAILGICKQIEAGMGRVCEGVVRDESGNRVYKSRPIDIDILMYGSVKINLPDLIVPHKDMNNRDFVMIPLKEIM